MSNYGRTKDNKSRLRLKDFHRRTITIEVIQSNLDCSVKPLPINPGSGSGGNGEKCGSFSYNLESVKKYWGGRYLGWSKKHITAVYNKSQLIGKIMWIHGKQYRVISKSL